MKPFDFSEETAMRVREDIQRQHRIAENVHPDDRYFVLQYLWDLCFEKNDGPMFPDINHFAALVAGTAEGALIDWKPAVKFMKDMNKEFEKVVYLVTGEGDQLRVRVNENGIPTEKVLAAIREALK